MTVSDQTDQKEVFKEIVHGLTECLTCILSCISQKQADDYDMAHPESDNPGESSDAPYHDQHMAGNVAESLLDIFVSKVDSKMNLLLWKMKIKKTRGKALE